MEPRAETTPASRLIGTSANWLALTGNAYWWLNAPSRDAPPTEIWLIPPDKLTPLPDGRMYVRGYEYRDGAYSETLPVEEIVHFRRFHPNNDFVGLSPVEALATIATGDMKMQQWNTNWTTVRGIPCRRRTFQPAGTAPPGHRAHRMGGCTRSVFGPWINPGTFPNRFRARSW